MTRPYAVAIGTLSGSWNYTVACAGCDEELKLTTASMGLLKRSSLKLLCPYCAEDRRVTRPMSAHERAMLLGETS